MTEGPGIARIASLMGDPARANMLAALMCGGALTVSELAAVSGVGLSTASSHATRLVDGGLLRARPSGRHRYLEIASPAVAALIEQIMALSAGSPAPGGSGAGSEGATPRGSAAPSRFGPRDPALREARVCYDHLAGAMGVQVYDSFTARDFFAQGPAGLALSAAGQRFVTDFGLDGLLRDPSRAPLCRDCLDWSHRRSHLAGRVGRALLSAMESRGWLHRIDGSRALRVTAPGRRSFDAAFPPGRRDDSLDAPAL